MENNKSTLKLTGLSEDDVNRLIQLISVRSNDDIDTKIEFAEDLANILLDKDTSLHYDVSDNKDHIIRF